MLIEIEKTPNPSTRKFLPGRTVMESGGRDFPNVDAAEASPLAEALFATALKRHAYGVGMRHAATERIVHGVREFGLAVFVEQPLNVLDLI